MKCCSLLLGLLGVFLSFYQTVHAQSIPDWLVMDEAGDSVLRIRLPEDLERDIPRRTGVELVLVELDPMWNPDWKTAAFKLKELVVFGKAMGGSVRVGLSGTKQQIDGLSAHETAAYIDGYVFTKDPYIPDADPTGKLWQQVTVPRTEVLSSLLDAASLGIEVVLFEGMQFDADHLAFLKAVRETKTGALDLQPEFSGVAAHEALLFYEPGAALYHLAVYAPRDQVSVLQFNLDVDPRLSLLFPEKARFRHKQYGSRVELRLEGDVPYYWFQLKPQKDVGPVETLEITRKKEIDPYELVVKNQVFKDGEAEKFQSLQVEEEMRYSYTVAGGASIDVDIFDTVVIRKGKPVERIRNDLFVGGVRWRFGKKENIPLIQPEKVQQAPLEIDLNKSYEYRYEGEDTVSDRKAWKVGFEPKDDGNFYSGSVWIDQENGAHLKVRAVQSGLEAPVIGNEFIVWYDWVEDKGTRFWVQVREENLQVLSILGGRLALQIESTRSNYRFNESDIEAVMAKVYDSDVTILKDTAAGFRYLLSKDGERVLDDGKVKPVRMGLGGVFIDPAVEGGVVPLAGFNYTHLDWLGKGYQANFFVAGVLNDLIVSHPDFLGTGMDFTAELFAQALYFGDSVYENGEEVEDLEVEQLRESINLTLGMPLNSFWKASANYSLRYRDYREADETREDFVIPSQHLEHLARFSLEYSRRSFTADATYQFAKRSEWDPWGTAEDMMEPLQDSYRTLSVDLGWNHKLPKLQSLEVGGRYLKGWDQDRFSRFGFGTFENNVAGFGSSGIRADEAYILNLEYEIGVEGLMQFEIGLDAARAKLNAVDINGLPLLADPVDMLGIGVGANFPGPWNMLMRANVGYGIHSDLAGEEGEVVGQIVFLKVF